MPYEWQADACIRIFRRRPARRYIVQTSGGYFPVLARLPDGRLGLVARDGSGNTGPHPFS